jgi:hypothetical protein
MSSKTPIETTTAFKGIDLRLQNIAAAIKTHLSWLAYSFGLTDRIVELRDKKPYIYPAIYQDLNSKELISCMPSDLYTAFAFWTKEPKAEFKPESPNRIFYNISVIFYLDLRHIAPTQNWKLVKSNIRQDILQVFRTHQFIGEGVLNMLQYVDDDITEVYKEFSIEQVDNKFKMYPKYALRIDFEHSFLMECQVNNIYA